jgi:hypothetical protein
MSLLIALISLAHAEEAAFEKAAAPPAEAPKTETALTASVGGTLSTGNSESVTFIAGLDARHKWRRNQLGLVGGAAIGFGANDANADGFLDEGERCLGVEGLACPSTAERYALDARYDRFLNPKSSLYVLVGGFHDKFAGFELRTHAQVGFASNVVDRKRTRLSIEAGADLASEAYVAGVEPASALLLAVQLGAGLEHKINDNVSFADSITLYEPLLTQPEGAQLAPHLSDVRIGNTAALNVKMSDRFSLSLADTLSWRNEPISAPVGVDGTRANLDNTLSVAIVASIL